MNSQRHVIKKQVLDLHLSSDIEAFELQNKISSIYHSKIISLIESVCDRLSKSEQIQRIDRLSIDLGEIDERSLETDFVDRFAECLFQKLAEKLNSSTTNSSLSISASDNDNFDRQPAFTPAIQKFHSTHLSASESDSTLPTIGSKIELIDYFLQTGRLPWWSELLSKQALEDCCEQLLQTSPDVLKALLKTKLKQIKILNRLIYQFSDRILLGIVNLFVPDWSKWLRDYIQDLQTMTTRVKSWRAITSQQFRLVIWQGIFLQLSLDSASSFSSEFVIQSSLCYIASSYRVDVRSLFTEISQTVEHFCAENSFFNSHLSNVVTAYLSTETSKKAHDSIDNPLVSGQQENTLSLTSSQFIYPKQFTKSQPFELIDRYTQSTYSIDTFNDSEEIYLQNSGLVLLCPFLNRLFNRLTLCKDKHFVDFDSSKRAVLILQYIVDKSCEFFEYSLPLNKILCGLDIDEAIETQIYPSELEQKECDELLLAIIYQWSALKNTTPQGFVRSFIQRSGILKIHNGNWLLQVEKKTYDVLLEKLPWNINMIKLPWMNTLLYINW